MPTHEDTRERDLFCPSATREQGETSLVFGVVVGTSNAPDVAYLEAPVPLTEALRALTDGLEAEEVFRTTTRCSESACHYYSGSHCRLAIHIVETLPAVRETLPACAIRATCRWFAEERGAACLRCPQVVTQLPARAAEGSVPSKRRLPVV
jgi:hypothetical protein